MPVYGFGTVLRFIITVVDAIAVGVVLAVDSVSVFVPSIRSIDMGTVVSVDMSSVGAIGSCGEISVFVNSLVLIESAHPA